MAEPVKPPLAVRARRWVRTTWRTLVRERSSPTQIGIAVWWGVVVGCCPFYGFQNLLAISTSTLFRLNRVAVVLAAQVTTPPLNVLIVFASVQLGHRIRSGSWLAASMAEVRATPIEDLAHGLGLDFLVGSFAFGGTLGVPIGLIAAWAVARARRSHDPERELPEALRADLEERLDFAPGWYRGYGGWKVKLDPVYPLALRALEGRRSIADLGGGIGLLAALLAARDPEARVKVVEWDEKKASVARTVARDLPGIEVIAADATTFDASGCDAVALIDVLHYLPIPEQRAWLTRLVNALGPEATVVVRELDSSAEKGRLAEIVDRWMVRLGWNRGGGVHAWPIAEMRELLEREGFAVEVAEAGRGIFSANAIVVARRP